MVLVNKYYMNINKFILITSKTFIFLYIYIFIFIKTIYLIIIIYNFCYNKNIY